MVFHLMQYLCTEQTNHGGLELGLDAVDIWLLKSHVVYVVRNVLTDGVSSFEKNDPFDHKGP